MPRKFLKIVAWVVVVGAGVAALGWFAWPRPVQVDLAQLTTGPMAVSIEDVGKTQIRHIYTVSAPISGKVLRLSNPAGSGDMSIHVGDPVVANETVVAVIQPIAPSLLDSRSREELQAGLTAAAAAVKFAESEVGRIQVALDFSVSELNRAQSLASTDTISAKTLDAAKFAVATNQAALQSAKAQLEVRRSELAMANARLLDPSTEPAQATDGCCMQIRSPASGIVMKVLQDSESVVNAGTPLLEIGDPRDMQVVADLLSTDAVQTSLGADVQIDGWGGPPLRGRLTQVEPEGFVKVSALGIDEQRVRTIVDFVDPPQSWAKLGNDFRVVVHVALWSEDNVLTVPVAALYRKGDDWEVFAVKDGKAEATKVTIGHRNDRSAEVLTGVAVGDQVVLHLSDRIKDGTAVVQRAVE